MMRILDCNLTIQPLLFRKRENSEKDEKLKRSTAIGTGLGMLTANLLLTKGNLKKLPNVKYGIPQVMLLCSGAAVGGYTGANFATSENKKGRTLELKNQLLYNDLLPLFIMEGVNKVYRTTNKLLKSLVLSISLLLGTFACHKLAEISLKKKGIEDKGYPVEPAHLIAEFDDYLLPIAVATQWKWLQTFLKVISPVTFFPLGMSIGKVKNEKYF